MTTPTPTPSEVRRLSDAILGRIVAGAYPAGLRLPSEVDLAALFSCGRSTVREALRHLTGLGVVQSRRGSGAMVLDFRREGTPSLLPSYLLAGRFDRPAEVLARELLGIRTLLALEAVRLAARYADAAGLAEARALLARAPSLERDPAAHARNDLEVFRVLVCASGIWPAVWLANAFWAPMRELHNTLASAAGVQPDYQRQMERLLSRIEARDEAGAERHLRAFLDRVDTVLLVLLEGTLGGAPPPAAAGKKAKPGPRAHARRPVAPATTKRAKAVRA